MCVCIFSKALSFKFLSRVLVVLGAVSFGFLAFIVFTSDPFIELIPPPLQGKDLNPLLQDPGMMIHPPMLYMGYVGFCVAFAFSIAGLMAENLNSEWAEKVRPWVLAAWVFLTAGIGLGSWWAYNELGWGGWWFWDPVENASFMPWLVGTALIHSVIVTQKRNIFQNWTALLSIVAFSLSLLGTFLVRSGVLVSVHAFANDPERGIFILFFLSLTVGISLLIFAIKAHKIKTKGGFDIFSRETLLLINNILSPLPYEIDGGDLNDDGTINILDVVLETELANSKTLPYSKPFEIDVCYNDKKSIMDLKMGLHQYVYNVGDENIKFNWEIENSFKRDELKPGDSVYIKPNIPHSFRGEGKLMVLRIAGRMAGDAQRELSCLDQNDANRAISETSMWFDPEGKH